MRITFTVFGKAVNPEQQLPRFAGLPDDQLTVILTRDYVQSRGARASRTHQFLGKELLGK